MFIPDERSVGGKNLVDLHVSNHYKKLSNFQRKAKKSKDNFRKHSERKSKSRPRVNEIPNEPFYTFSRVIEIEERKPNKTQKSPACFPLRPKSKKQKYEEIEHQKMLKKMNSAIYSEKKYEERRADPSDPIGNPVYFFRKEKDNLKPISIYPYMEELVERNKLNEDLLYEIEEYFKLNRDLDLTKTFKQSKIKEKKVKAGLFEKFRPVKPLNKHGVSKEGYGVYSNGMLIKDFEDYILLEESPKINVSEYSSQEEALKGLKLQLIDIIVGFRIFKDSQIDDLFWKTMKNNSELDPLELKLLLTALKSDFENVNN